MTWNNPVIDGQQSVAANKTPLNQNSAYIETSMQVDHYWDNANSNLDGHHQFVQMPKTESGGNPANPSIATDIDGVLYCKDKTATEAPEAQNPEPYYIMNDGSNDQIMQMGIRAMVTFRISGSAIVTNGGNNWDYMHNISAVSRTSAGNYTITFTTAMPTNRYVAIATCESTSTSNSSGMRVVQIQNASKTTTTVKIKVQRVQSDASVTNSDPSSISVIIIGG